ncbi:MAG: hypothetical protein A2511_09365 [Deltaproteobacteria bacterium RIFOXYD12_FULL_50_9]|nr:MAG: hypothetical protein A2511_09365 [Deltaproteobacteria bacterium RIFOXYD12_FULL_50_9]
MSSIRILSENLANQIAAGEVVERPASVVKEFLENAVDAGARQISVFVEGGGTRLLKVIDDGQGMDQDDIMLCLERHATSKIATQADLAAIHTLGFRGEAIPSIASVSLLTITSRPHNFSLGTMVEVRYGRVEKVHEMGCAAGTVMEVRNLFGNVPARRKFLKSAQTELFHIEEVVRSYAIQCHGLGISYSVDGREIFSLQPAPDAWEERIRSVLGRKFAAVLIPVHSAGYLTGEAAELGIAGFLLPPAVSHGTSIGLRLFVNNRSIRDRLVQHAVSEGLQGALMKGQRPAGVLCLSLQPEAVDVNVHPTKQEDRFQKPNAVHQLVVTTVRNAVQQYQDGVRQVIFAPRTRSLGESVRPPVQEINRRASAWNQSELPVPLQTRETDLPGQEVLDAVHEPMSTVGFPPVLPEEQSIKNSSASTAAPTLAGQGVLRPIGQIFNAYILCESEEGLVAIDQHAAQERMLFEALKEQYSAKGVARQQLLFPAMIECSAAEIEAIHRYGEEICRFGIDIAEFGGASFVIKAVPAVMARIPPEETVRGILEQLAGDSGEAFGPAARRLETVLAGMACKAAIKAGQPLDSVEIESLLCRMRETKDFCHCPHGRPVLKCFSAAEIRKWFQRT